MWGTTLLEVRLEAVTEALLADYQADFRKRRETSGKILIMEEIMITCYEDEIPASSLDFNKVYDSIRGEKLMKVMKECDTAPKLLNLLSMILKTTTSYVKIWRRKWEKFEVRTGLRQGNPLSTLSLNCILEKIMRTGQVNREGSLGYKNHQVVCCRCHTVITRNSEVLQKFTKGIIEMAYDMELQRNVGKGKIITVGTYKPNNIFRIETQ